MRPAIEHILVPIDFSPSSDAAVDYAATLARSLGASIHLLHVREDSFAGPAPYELHPPGGRDRRERSYQLARARLSGIAAQVEDAAARVTVEVRSGTPTDAIVQAAVDYGADLVVMGTHGRSGLQHLLLGSVAEQVIRSARCPVLAVRETTRIAAAPHVLVSAGAVA